MRAGWVLKVVSKSTIDQSLQKLLEIIQETGSVVEFELLWDNSEDLHKFPQTFLKHIISLSKDIIETTDHKYGLSTWPTVNPKNVRDKIYYILNESGKPLHFTEIAKRIGGSSFDGKKIVQPTVHNELIADNRFVLVGRGIYALTQWGYAPGTVEEVIEDVLKKAKRPMTTDEIVEEVLKSRQVKKNTIIINLQIKPQFIKVGRKLYSLNEIDKSSVTKEVKAVLKATEAR
jgi:DNA-directed RNA polymerase delta subunit